jgi:cobalt transporter subunit CbtB
VTRKPGDLPATPSATAPSGGGRTGDMMTNKPALTTIVAPDARLASRVMQITLAALLGLLVIGGVGFAQIEAVHSAAHDYRHSMGFPCH